MPSLQDIADQANAKLDTIINNTSATAQHTAAIDQHLQAGFANLSQGLFLVTELQKVANALLDQLRKQNDTIICLIENSNELLCGMTRKLTRQLAVSEATLKLVDRIEGVTARAYPAEAADYDRDAALQAKIDACCPPTLPPLEPCPEDCPKPPFHGVDPRGGDWKPLPTPKGGTPATPAA
jgi:hypothetical protein